LEPKQKLELGCFSINQPRLFQVENIETEKKKELESTLFLENKKELEKETESNSINSVNHLH